jgi:2-haloacid dehalogenase
MSDLDHIGRRAVLAGIGAAALGAFFNPTRVRAQALDRAPSVLVFDVAESLLDLQALRPLFQRVFGDGAMVDEWFGETILYSESATLTNTFISFGQLGAGVLRMLGRIHNVAISEADVAEFSKGLASLPPHPDVPDSLRKLKAAGYRLVSSTMAPSPNTRWNRGRNAWRSSRLSATSKTSTLGARSSACARTRVGLKKAPRAAAPIPARTARRPI